MKFKNLDKHYKTITCSDNAAHKINLNEDEVCIIRSSALLSYGEFQHILCKECTLIRKNNEPENYKWLSKKFMSPDEVVNYFRDI